VLKLPGLAWACLALLSAPALAEKPRPLVSVLGTCSALNGSIYPADAQVWFDANKQSQVVFYAHLLFPTVPEAGQASAAVEAWHPPLLVTPTASALSPVPAFVDQFYAQAEWLDPEGKRIALSGMTLSARLRSDLVLLDGRWYAPHTFAPAIGTRDLRSQAGQTLLPEKAGQYHVRLSVDGQAVGVGFFSMLKTAPSEKMPPPSGLPLTLSPTGLPAALSRAAQK
jgi:hypothetical protein